MNKAVVNKQDIAIDERAKKTKEVNISTEFQMFVFEAFVDKTNYVIDCESGEMMELVHEDQANVTIDFSNDPKSQNTYQRMVKNTVEKLEQKINDPNIDQKAKSILVSLKSSINDLKKLEIDNIHVVYDKNQFDKKHKVELKIGNQIMIFETPYVHLVEVTMLSDKEKLEDKLKQVIKQLTFIVEYSNRFFSMLADCYDIVSAIKSEEINLYCTIVSGHQFRDEKVGKLWNPLDVFNQLTEYQDYQIFDCFRFNKMLKDVSEFVEAENFAERFKQRSDKKFKINHISMYNPFSQTEVAQLISKFETRLDKSIEENKIAFNTFKDEINNRMTGLEGQMTGLESRITTFESQINTKVDGFGTTLELMYKHFLQVLKDNNLIHDIPSRIEQALPTIVEETKLTIEKENNLKEDLKTEIDTKDNVVVVANPEEGLNEETGINEDVKEDVQSKKDSNEDEIQQNE